MTESMAEDLFAGVGEDVLTVPVEFAYHADRLVGHLFEAGLGLHRLRAGLDPHAGEGCAAADLRVGVDAVLDTLDTVIHDTGLAIVALIHGSEYPP
ncbi:hypothetical protein [Nocardia blacklockiae]|uniref:hypothetical protein n=1 Tax=Nocardia blacklockiae TaxID=480036 RepID=UPI0018936F10|nr:hypothetical protein [Nocardia blacklockiae]MBF6175195.1 hypothetical protein [Nocardia blacklockiae]